jgi:hypothetical protein
MNKWTADTDGVRTRLQLHGSASRGRARQSIRANASSSLVYPSSSSFSSSSPSRGTCAHVYVLMSTTRSWNRLAASQQRLGSDSAASRSRVRRASGLNVPSSGLSHHHHRPPHHRPPRHRLLVSHRLLIDYTRRYPRGVQPCMFTLTRAVRCAVLQL